MKSFRDNLLRVCSVLCLTVLVTTGSAAAINQNDLNSILNNTPFYDPTATECSATSATTTSSITVTGNNVMDAMTALVKAGYSPQQAAGITGNLMWESDGSGGDIVPTAQTPGNPAYGIAQWQGDRLTEMRAWVTAKGEDPTSFQGQMDFELYELSTTEIGAANAVKATSTVKDATDVFEQQDERAGDPKLPEREANANAAYMKYNSGDGSVTATTASTTGTTCGCSGSATPGAGDAAHTIVLDPGHATKANEDVDPATDEPVFDYSNPVEQQQVWDMSQDLTTKLQALGYTVLNTKQSEDDTNTNLKQRAEVGNNANAALGVSLHTTPGSPAVGNDVFYPNVGDYIVKVNGQHDTYTNQTLSATDQADAQKMAADLTAAEPGVTFRAGSYDQLYGPITRVQDGITMQGTMLTTQYFATVPWVYIEQYQDAPGAAVSAQGMQDYENGVLKGIEDIVPPPNGTAAATGSVASTGSCAPVSCSAGTNVTGDAKILCEAEQYNGIYYLWGGGHNGYSAFTSACTPSVLATAAQNSTTANPGPCATDCSGLVSMALDQAFGLDYDWTVAGSMQGAGSQYWQQIPISQAQAGDIVTTPEHVEIVDHVQGNTVYTFGSHYTGSKTSAVTTVASDWPSGAWHWTGPGSS